MEDNQKPSTSSDATTYYIPIASKDERVVEPGPTRKYEGPDFVHTIIAMRQKLFELQKATEGDEPTTDQAIIKIWKNSNKLINGDINVSNFLSS